MLKSFSKDGDLRATLTGTRRATCVTVLWLSVAVALSSPATAAVPAGGEQTPLNSCADMAPERLCNYQDVYVCEVAAVVHPRSVNDVVTAVKAAAAAGRPVRAIGHAHSDNDVFCAPGSTTLLMASLNQVLSVDTTSMTAEVQAGITLGAFNAALDAHDLAVAAFYPAYRNLTVGGIIGTGAHGSSLTFPNVLGDAVRSLEIVLANGTLARFSRGEDWFDAARTSLGLLGVITSFVFDLVPQYKIRAVQTVQPDAVLFTETPVETARRVRYVTYAWFPVVRKLLVEVGTPEPLSAPGDGEDVLMDKSPLFIEAFALMNELALKDPGLSCWLANNSFHEQISSPPFGHAGQPVSANVTGRSHLMMAGTCTAGDCPWLHGLRIHDMEFALPLSNFTAVTTWLRSFLTNPDNELCFPLQGVFFRFGGQSTSLLDPGAGQEFFVLEIASWRPYHGVARYHEAAYDRISHTLLTRFHGRPHWGKNSNATFAATNAPAIARNYGPTWQRFWDIRSTLDPTGVFLNAWARGLMPAPHTDGPATPPAASAQV